MTVSFLFSTKDNFNSDDYENINIINTEDNEMEHIDEESRNKKEKQKALKAKHQPCCDLCSDQPDFSNEQPAMTQTATKFSSWLSNHKLAVHKVEDRYAEELAAFKQLRQKFIIEAGLKPMASKKGINGYRCKDCDFRTLPHNEYGYRDFAIHRKYHHDLEKAGKSVENVWAQGKRLGAKFLFPCAYCDDGEHQSYKESGSN